jgi:hypothetical protein
MRILGFFILTQFFLYSSAQSVNFQSTDIALFIIDTDGKTILDEPKIEANLKIISNENGARNSPSDAANIYDGKIGIEYRGAFSQMLPQKPYGFETWDEFGDEINISLFGFPQENDWILLANYNDKSFVRNSLIFQLFRQMGHYAPRTVHCELLLDDSYQGIYVFTEKIKRDKGRVSIPKLDPDDNAGDSLTGGYIFKTDYSDGDDFWVSDYSPEGFDDGSVRFIYTYPKPKNITAEQRNYLSAYIDGFENTLFSSVFRDKNLGYRTYIDVNSFVDYFIIGEITRNVDAYKKSCYYYKQSVKKGGLIYAGPVWDFDWAMKNFYECIYRNTDGSGWAHEIFDCTDPRPDPVPPAWITRLISDPYFANKIHDRYYSLRNTILSESYLFNYIDSVKNVLNESQSRHYSRWPILGENVGTPEVDFKPTSFEGEIQKLKDWFSLRLDWLDENMIGEPSSIDDFEFSDHNMREIHLYPNPANDILMLESKTGMKEIIILTLDGNIVRHMNLTNELLTSIDTHELSSGLYLIRILANDSQIRTFKFVKR